MIAFDVLDIKQGSPEWFLARAGRVTGSEAASVSARAWRKVAGVEQWVDMAPRANYKTQLLCERLTGEPEESGFITKEMRDGIAREPFARMAYEARTGYSVRESGFLVLRDFMAGCSLDGDVNNFEGITESKCLKPKNHLAIIESGQIPDEYLPQITHNLFCSNAHWCDFIAFCPKFPKHLQLFVKRVERDEKKITEYRGELVAFLAEVKSLERRYREASVDELQSEADKPPF